MLAIHEVYKMAYTRAKFYLVLIRMLSNRRTRPLAKFVWRFDRQMKKFVRQMVKQARKGAFPGTATGEQLDRLATLYGIERGKWESDQHLRDRIRDSMESFEQSRRTPVFIGGVEIHEIEY